MLPEALDLELRQLAERVRNAPDRERVLPADVAQLRSLVLFLLELDDRMAERIELLEARQQAMADRCMELLARIERLEGPCP